MAELEAAYRLVHLWRAADPESLIDEVATEIQAVVSSGERGLSAALIERMPRLEIVACFGVGYDRIDVAACRGRGIPVTNTPDVLSRDVADLGLGLILMTLRRMAEADRFVRAGRMGRCRSAPASPARSSVFSGLGGSAWSWPSAPARPRWCPAITTARPEWMSTCRTSRP
jgi:lactate dehydrogenase-like 2-hydroxyacid dehydrogenase